MCTAKQQDKNTEEEHVVVVVVNGHQLLIKLIVCWMVFPSIYPLNFIRKRSLKSLKFTFIKPPETLMQWTINKLILILLVGWKRQKSNINKRHIKIILCSVCCIQPRLCNKIVLTDLVLFFNIKSLVWSTNVVLSSL